MIYACATFFGSVCVFFPGVFLHSRVTEACPVTTKDLIMRVNVKTTTTTTTTATSTRAKTLVMIPGIEHRVQDTSRTPIYLIRSFLFFHHVYGF